MLTPPDHLGVLHDDGLLLSVAVNNDLDEIPLQRSTEVSLLRRHCLQSLGKALLHARGGGNERALRDENRQQRIARMTFPLLMALLRVHDGLLPGRTRRGATSSHSFHCQRPEPIVLNGKLGPVHLEGVGETVEVGLVRLPSKFPVVLVQVEDPEAGQDVE